MAIGVLPNQIPVSGERYNLTLRRVGEYKGNQVAHFIIDSGEYKGKLVSCYVTSTLLGILETKLSEFNEDADFGIENPLFYRDLNAVARLIRLSGTVIVSRQAAPNDEMIEVDADYQESNVMVTYDITDFGEPTNEESDIKRNFTNA